MSKPTIAELQLKLSLHGLHYATSLRSALMRVGGREIRAGLDAQARSILGIESAMKRASGASSGFGNFLKGAARGTIVAQGLYRGFKMVGGAIGDALQPLMEFQHNMARVRVKGQLSIAETEAASNAVKGMTGSTLFSPTEASTAAVGLAAAGQGRTLGSSLPTVLRFAQANDVDPEEATKILLGTMGQFKRPIGDLEQIGDQITKADAMSVLSVTQIFDTLKYVGPLAKDAKMPLQEVLAMVVSLGDAGIVASKGGTGLRNLLSAIAAPPRRAKAAQKVLGLIGLTQEDLRKGFSDIPALLANIDARMVKHKIDPGQRMAINKILFGQYGMTATSALMGDSKVLPNGKTGIEGFREEITTGSAGMMRSGAAIMGETLEGKVRRLSAQWELLKINMGERFLPVLESTVKHFEMFTKKMNADPTFFANLDKLADGLGKALPPALATFTAGLEGLLPPLRQVALLVGEYAQKEIGKEGGFRDVSDADQKFARDKAAMDAVTAAQTGKGPVTAGGPRAAAEQALREYDEREKKLRGADKRARMREAFESLSPEKQAELAAKAGDKLVPDNRNKNMTSAEGPGEVDIAIVLQTDGELKAMIRNLKKGKGPDLRVGTTSTL